MRDQGKQGDSEPPCHHDSRDAALLPQRYKAHNVEQHEADMLQAIVVGKKILVLVTDVAPEFEGERFLTLSVGNPELVSELGWVGEQHADSKGNQQRAREEQPMSKDPQRLAGHIEDRDAWHGESGPHGGLEVKGH